MKLTAKIDGQFHQFVIFNLCSQNGYSDYEGIVDGDLTLDMAAVVERVRAMGFHIDAWNNQLCLAQDGRLYLTIYPSGRIILERVSGDDPKETLFYFQQVLGARIDR